MQRIIFVIIFYPFTLKRTIETLMNNKPFIMYLPQAKSENNSNNNKEYFHGNHDTPF
jgi:hypothetical protein